MTLDELRRAVDLLPAESTITLKVETLRAALSSIPSGPVLETSHEAPEERWLTATEVAAMLNVSPRWCYDHKKDLGAKRLSRRCTRFAASAVERRLARRAATV